MPLFKNETKILLARYLKYCTVWARTLIFGILIIFWINFVHKILIELRPFEIFTLLARYLETVWANMPWYLVYWLRMRCRLPDYLLTKFHKILTELRPFAIFANFYAPSFEKVDGAYCFWLVHVYVTLFMPPVTLELCILGSWNFIYRIPHGKKADPYFFFFPSYAPFWNYVSFKKWDGNFVSKILQKLFELGPWYLVCWLGLWSRTLLTFEQILLCEKSKKQWSGTDTIRSHPALKISCKISNKYLS